MRHQSRRWTMQLVAAATILGLATPAAALTLPPVETTMAHTNCGTSITNNPGPGTRGATCTGEADAGTGGRLEVDGMSVTSQGFEDKARVQGTCQSIPYPETGSAPAAGWVGYSRGEFSYKVVPTHAGASAATVSVSVKIKSTGFGMGGWGDSSVTGWRHSWGEQMFHHIQPFDLTEHVDLVPQSVGVPDSGEYLRLAHYAACTCLSSMSMLIAICDSSSIAEVTIDPADPAAGDYTVVKAPNPSAMVLRMADAATLEWDPVVDAMSYDIVRGNLNMLRSTTGDFSAATESCDGDGVTGTSLPVAPAPVIGDAWFYLGRVVTLAGNGSFDTMGGGFVAPRDTEIAASGNDCP